jgi:hypothetical protein
MSRLIPAQPREQELFGGNGAQLGHTDRRGVAYDENNAFVPLLRQSRQFVNRGKSFVTFSQRPIPIGNDGQEICRGPLVVNFISGRSKC